MVNKGIALAILLAMTSAASAQVAKDETSALNSSLISHKLSVSELDKVDAHVKKLTPATQKLDEKSDGKGAKAPSRLSNIGNWIVSAWHSFCGYFSF
jgi:hypothetical protein